MARPACTCKPTAHNLKDLLARDPAGKPVSAIPDQAAGKKAGGEAGGPHRP
jgi:hypothetical protein